MTPEQLLQYAKDNYTKGTKCQSLGVDAATFITSGEFKQTEKGISDAESGYWIYMKNTSRWAEILERPANWQINQSIRLEGVKLWVDMFKAHYSGDNRFACTIADQTLTAFKERFGW